MRTDILERKEEIEQWIAEGKTKDQIVMQKHLLIVEKIVPNKCVESIYQLSKCESCIW